MGREKGRKSRWEGVDYMALIPRRAYGWDEDPQTGTVAVLTPRYRDPVFGRLLQPRLPAAKRFLRVPLEARGAFLWRQIDGRCPVRDLVAAFVAAFPDDADDAPRRVSLFLQAMYDNKFITFLNLPA